MGAVFVDLPQVARFFIFGSIEITLKLRAKDRNCFEIACGRPEGPPGICPCVAREQSEVHKIKKSHCKTVTNRKLIFNQLRK